MSRLPDPLAFLLTVGCRLVVLLVSSMGHKGATGMSDLRLDMQGSTPTHGPTMQPIDMFDPPGASLSYASGQTPYVKPATTLFPMWQGRLLALRGQRGLGTPTHQALHSGLRATLTKS